MLVQNLHINQKDLYCFKNWINLWVYRAQPRGFLFPHSGWCRNNFNFSIQIELSFLEPIGGAGPKFAHESKGSILVKELSQAISLSCPAQGFPVPAFRLDFAKFWSYKRVLKLFTEPIGGAKPKFSLFTDSIQLTRTAESSICLTCPAQAFPIPAFRLVL